MSRVKPMVVLYILIVLLLSGCSYSTGVDGPLPSAPDKYGDWEGPNIEGIGSGEDAHAPETSTPTQAPDLEITESPDVGPLVSKELPEAATVSPVDTPLLYDFVYGCLDWHVSIHRDEFESDFYIMRNLKVPNTIHSDWYVVQAGFTFPPTGSKIRTQDMDEDMAEKFEKAVASLPPERIITEGDWELYLLQSFDSTGVAGFNNGTWGGISDKMFAVLQVYSDGEELPFMTDGSGWPMEWVRREPYVTALKNAGIDLSADFWKEWGLLARHNLVSNVDGTVVGYVVANRPNEFLVYNTEFNDSTAPMVLSYDQFVVTVDSLTARVENAPDLSME